MTTHPITPEIRAAARALLDTGKRLTGNDKRRLKAIADPASRRKLINIHWWRWLHGVDLR
jgi:hypothetical protein